MLPKDVYSDLEHKLYLINTLEPNVRKQKFRFARFINKEAREFYNKTKEDEKKKITDDKASLAKDLLNYIDNTIADIKEYGDNTRAD